MLGWVQQFPVKGWCFWRFACTEIAGFGQVQRGGIYCRVKIRKSWLAQDNPPAEDSWRQGAGSRKVSQYACCHLPHLWMLLCGRRPQWEYPSCVTPGCSQAHLLRIMCASQECGWHRLQLDSDFFFKQVEFSPVKISP